VLLAVTINADGRADARAIETRRSPDVLLTDEAARWVRGAKFVPACLAGRPIRLRVAIPVDFKLGN